MSDNSDEGDYNAISRQIVDYYKKYSLNKHLPKYFSGTSLSYMPPIVKDDEFREKPTPLITIDESQCEPLIEEKEVEEPRALSPTSSVTSNRKLEWDNGADIGYSNLKLQKSLSLPILLEPDIFKGAEKTVSPKLSTQIVSVISYSKKSSSDKQISSLSSSSNPSEVLVDTSSSSVRTDLKQIPTTSSSYTSTVAYLKNKIGSPYAESTPKLSSSSEKCSDTSNVGKSQKKVINLVSTKPITIECLSKSLKAADKIIQTNVKNVTKSVQTGDSLEQLPTVKNKPKKLENQSVIIINYDSESDKKTCSSNTQTDVDKAVSECDSFEYYKNQNLPSPSSKSIVASSSNSSKDYPILGHLISEQRSKSLIGDIDKSLELLQKLLKSRKYDVATKKRYIKKIVEKIVDQKYNEDSTTSSELFIPKKPNEEPIQKNIKEASVWPPKLTVKTFSDEFLPNDSKKRSIFSLSQAPEDRNGTQTSLNNPNQSSGSYESWKEGKTTSELLLEEKKGQGDQLVNFAKQERQHQIAWINDEISHLTKLKSLLEKKIHRTTTIYTVTQELPKSSSYSSSGSNSRDYVIQTELSSSSSELPVEYNLCEKARKSTYRVGQKTKISKRVVGDIEVVSDDKTTNISVKTKTLGNNEFFKPKPPTLIGIGKYDTFPRSRAEQERCLPCGRLHSIRGTYCSPSKKQTTSNNSNLADKVREILRKYNYPATCSCCKCPSISKNSISSSASSNGKSSKGKDVGEVSDHNKIIQASKSENPADIEDVEVQTCTNCQCKNVGTNSSSLHSTDVPNNCPEDATNNSKNGELTHVVKRFSKDENFGNGMSDQKLDPITNVLKDHSSENQVKNLELDSKTQSYKSLDSKTSSLKKVEPAENISKSCQCLEMKSNHFREEEGTDPTNITYIDSEMQTKTSKNDKSTDPTRAVYQNSQIQTCNCKKDESTEPLKRIYRSSEIQTCECTKDEVVEVFDDTSTTLKSTTMQTCDCLIKEPTQNDFTQTQPKDSKKDEYAEIKGKIKETESAEGLKDELPRKSPVQEYLDSNPESDTSSSVDISSSSSGTYSDTSSPATVTSCICCKRKKITSKKLQVLRKELSNQEYQFCRPCYKQNQRSVYPANFYNNPAHTCKCYTTIKTKTLNELKRTIEDLNDLEQCCTCSGNDRNNSICKYCRRKLDKTYKNRNGIAYMVTFENTSLKTDKKKKSRDLEEIKIKIPVAVKQKKDKENKRKKQSLAESDNSSGNPKRKTTSLQEYLKNNRPEFVQGADVRRRTVNMTRNQREELSDFNKLLFLKKCQEECEKNVNRLFSAKEMKEINRRNYKKLPEVQQKLHDNREKQLREASRLMADRFNRKLQENVLKGKKNLPTDAKVIDI